MLSLAIDKLSVKRPGPVSFRAQLNVIVALFVFAAVALSGFLTWRAVSEILARQVDQQIASNVAASAISEQRLAFRDGRISEDEAFERSEEAVRSLGELNAAEPRIERLVLISVGLGLLATLLVGSSARRMTHKLSCLVEALGKSATALVQGAMEVDIPVTGGSDETDQIARAMHCLKDVTAERAALEGELEKSRRRSEEKSAAHAAERDQEERLTRQAVDALSLGFNCVREGDLTFRIEEPFGPKLETLRLDFNTSNESLKQVAQGIRASASAIDDGISKFLDAAAIESRRAEQQAAGLERSSAALDELSTNISKTAGGAAQARAVVTSAKAGAEQGGIIVRQAITAMGEIEKSSSQIGQIVGVIGEIAFQTNLLALNAGVEAARAGEAGRGFAVVAAEVRALAQRSSRAAKEINALVTTSNEQVEQGVSLVGRTGEAFEGIASQIKAMNSVVAGIAVGAHEQTTCLQQVNATLKGLDQDTQRGAAVAEKAVVLGEALAREAEILKGVASHFRLGGAQESGNVDLLDTFRPASAKRLRESKRIVRQAGGAMPRAAAVEWEEL